MDQAKQNQIKKTKERLEALNLAVRKQILRNHEVMVQTFLLRVSTDKRWWP